MVAGLGTLKAGLHIPVLRTTTPLKKMVAGLGTLKAGLHIPVLRTAIPLKKTVAGQESDIKAE